MKAIKPRLLEVAQELKASQRIRNATSGIQDALDGFFSTLDRGILPWGHGNSYYNRLYNKKVKVFGFEAPLKAIYQELGFDASSQTKVKMISRQYEAASEAFANVCEAVTVGGEALELANKYMPNSVAAFMKIMELAL